MSRRWLLQPTEKHQAQKQLLPRVAETLALPGPLDNEGIERLLEEATSNGFIGQPIKDASKALIKHAAKQREFAYIR